MIYISYSGKKTYLQCPLKYKYIYINRLAIKGDRTAAIRGIVIDNLFEKFYNDKLYIKNQKEKNFGLESYVDYVIDRVFEKEALLPEDNVEFRYRLKQETIAKIEPTLETIKKHKLIKDNSKSSVNLSTHIRVSKFSDTVKLVGIADFIHGYGKSVWILDGKNYMKKEADLDQLLFYATLYAFKYKVVPSRLGFLFYMFKDDQLQWVDFNEDMLRESFNKTIHVISEIRKGKFHPKPSVSSCANCKFRHICEHGKALDEEIRLEKGILVESSLFDLEKI